MKRTQESGSSSNALPVPKKSLRIMSTEISILQLPPEILTIICQLLELSDRKSIRLTCKSFYDACNCMSIKSYEKIVIRKEYVKDITKTLLSCQYFRLDLEFQGLPLNTLPVKIWSQCGEKIYSLTFHRTSMINKVLKNVITHCRNLKHWEVWIDPRESLSCQASHEAFIKPFAELVKQKVIRNELETFQLFIDTDFKYPYNRFIGNQSIWTSLTEKIFAIFPRLKTFGVLSRCSKDPPDYSSSTTFVKFAFTPIDDCLIPANVERLLIDVPSDGNWLKNSSVWNLRLKEIQTSLGDTEGILERLLNFFSHQKLLEVISLAVDGISDGLVKKLLFHILKVCPNLRRLQLSYPAEFIISLSDYEFSLLQEQRLEYLKLRFETDISLLGKITSKKKIELPMNRNLHTLIIDSPDSMEDDYDFLLLLEYFQNLKHLDVHCISDCVLQTIIKNHVNLEVLKLNNVEYCTDFGFTGHDSYERDPSEPVYSIKRLKNLQCLDINCGYYVDVSENTFSEFVFPKLKHVRFSFGNEEPMDLKETLVKIAENAPLLEVAFLDSPEIELNELLNFCSKLKKLYYVNYGNYETRGTVDSDYFEVFRSCPSLRFLALPWCGKILHFNPFTKKISSTESNNHCLHFKWSAEFAKIN